MQIYGSILFLFDIPWWSYLVGITKDGRIVEDRALGIYPNSVRSVHFYMTSLAAVLVLNSTINIKTLVGLVIK